MNKANKTITLFLTMFGIQFNDASSSSSKEAFLGERLEVTSDKGVVRLRNLESYFNEANHIRLQNGGTSIDFTEEDNAMMRRPKIEVQNVLFISGGEIKSERGYNNIIKLTDLGMEFDLGSLNELVVESASSSLAEDALAGRSPLKGANLIGMSDYSSNAENYVKSCSATLNGDQLYITTPIETSFRETENGRYYRCSLTNPIESLNVYLQLTKKNAENIRSSERNSHFTDLNMMPLGYFQRIGSEALRNALLADPKRTLETLRDPISKKMVITPSISEYSAILLLLLDPGLVINNLDCFNVLPRRPQMGTPWYYSDIAWRIWGIKASHTIRATGRKAIRIIMQYLNDLNLKDIILDDIKEDVSKLKEALINSSDKLENQDLIIQDIQEFLSNPDHFTHPMLSR